MKSENNFSGLLEMIVAIIVKNKKIDIKNLFGTLFKPLFIVPLKKLKIIINNRTIVDKPFAPYSKSPKISLSRNLPQG